MLYYANLDYNFFGYGQMGILNHEDLGELMIASQMMNTGNGGGEEESEKLQVADTLHGSEFRALHKPPVSPKTVTRVEFGRSFF